MSTVQNQLFGREKECEFLLEHFESAKEGHGSVILIGGEAGIGKTSLAETVALRVESEGALVARGHCLVGVPIPYFPISEALNRLFNDQSPTGSPVGLDDNLTNLDTGNQDLDKMLNGGIPYGHAVVLTAPSCDERDLFIRGFLGSGAKRGEVTFYVTIESNVAKPLTEKYPSNFCLLLCNPQADALIGNAGNVFKLSGVENLTAVNIALTSAIRQLNTQGKAHKRICIDLISDALLQHHAIQTRRWLTSLLADLKSKGFTTLAVVDPQMHSKEELHAVLGLFDGEICIYEKETRRGYERYLKIRKMSNWRYSDDEVLLRNVENELLLKRAGFLNWLSDLETRHEQLVLQKDELFQLIFEKLKELSSKRPLLLFLDDLHWADSASLILLHYLARNIRDTKMLLIGTYRSEELVDSAQGKPGLLLETMRMMGKEGLFESLELKELETDSIREITTTMISNPSESILELIAKKSEGNPFYAVESARFLISSGAITKENNQWELRASEEPLKMPTTIQDLIARRLSKLDRNDMQIIECASVVGEHFTPDILARALKLDELTVSQRLSMISKDDKLVIEEGREYQFEHARIRDAVYDGLGKLLAKALHNCVAEALLEAEGEMQVHQIAHHYHLTGAKDKIIKFGLMAGDHAKQQYAYSEATMYYGWVVEAIGEGMENPELRAEALVGRAESFHFEGLNQQAIADSEEALRISRVGLTRLRALRVCSESFFGMGHLTEAMQCVIQANSESGEAPIERLGLKRIHALFVGYKGDQKSSLDILREVSFCYLQIGMRGEYADCLLEMAAMSLSMGDIKNAVEATKEAEAIYHESDAGGWCYYVYQRLASIYFVTGEYSESSKNYAKAVELCLKFGLFEEAIWNESYWGQLNEAWGNYELAAEHLIKSLKAAELAEAPYPETGSCAVLARVYLHLGKIDEAERIFNRMNELYEKHSKDASLGLQGLVMRTRAYRMATQRLWKDADRDYLKSIELLHKGPLNVVHETEARIEYAEWLVSQKRNSEAKEQLRAAATIYESVGNHFGIDKINKSLNRMGEQ